ncbi:MAG TPA: peptidylprolyl isomerase [Candidatus Gastranaerophilaceae bacterium]|nr:peptidylprolyl isomerase [Candidatus Gastranaerophilaceae bacterium]HPT41399.1 peptidylprolyl isomerase [Candidatus Gastranaerophilaceae bacterium]
MNTKKLFATIAISALLLTGCSFGKKDVIIKVNDREITQTQYDQAFDKAAGNSMFAKMGIDIKKDKNGFLYMMIKDRVINELVVKALIDGEIEKRNIKVTKEDTDKELQNIIDKIGSKEKFNEILKQNGISSSQFKKDLTEEVKMKKLVNSLAVIKISDADAKKFYRQNLNKFKYPDKVRASHILIAANPEEIKEKITSDKANKNLSEEEVKAKIKQEINSQHEEAMKILTEVKKDPKSFERIAREKSQDTTSAKQGGDLGFFAKQEMVEPFAKAAFSLRPNTVSEIVQTPYGYHIILVTDRMSAGQEPFEKVKDEIKTYLEAQEQVKVLENLIESLKKQAKIEYVNPEYNPLTVQDILKKQAKSNPAAKEEMEPQSAAPPATPAKE